MLRVEIIHKSDLPEDEYGYYRDCWVMRVYHNDVLISEESDYGEPEDNSFVRDYKWIKPLLEKVYQLGKEDK